MKLLYSVMIASLAAWAAGSPISAKLGFSITEHPDPLKRDLVQQIVTWDEHSLFINGDRIMIFSGEVHPFRLPVPGLWLDVLQKIKALGFNCVSFYTDWALLEGKPGEYSADGIFSLESFFTAAQQAGLYLIARPGPYINAEASGGGFPGWLARVEGTPRTSDLSYLNATDNYIARVSATIANAQITNGGPVILVQAENEYGGSDQLYMQYVIDQVRNAGIDVPIINNDQSPSGHNAPGSGVGAVDIYGHDGYPLGFDCGSPTAWPSGNLPTDWYTKHLQESPATPYTIVEFQAGAFDAWNGYGFEQCAELLNSEFERVFYKNNLGFGVAVLNLYMTYGGTNWGNIGYASGYTSYDYAAPITENREVSREKYSELKLISNFVKVSKEYLTAVPQNLTTGVFTDTADLAVTHLKGQNGTGSFFVLRHADYTSLNSTSYRLLLPTESGTVEIPQVQGKQLSLLGRDSKIHVVDYNVGGTRLRYSTGEVFTWQQFDRTKVLVLYGAIGEYHEFALPAKNASLREGSHSSLTIQQSGGDVIVGWDVSTERYIVQIGDLLVILLDRNSAFNYWAPELSNTQGSTNLDQSVQSIIVNAGYLVRNASLDGDILNVFADFNATTTMEIIGVPSSAKGLSINGKKFSYKVGCNRFWSTQVNYAEPEFTSPVLSDLDWRYINTLPEVDLNTSYDDSAWTNADRPTLNNKHPLTTPTSLYGADYGYNTGSLVYRGQFTSAGNESSFSVTSQGGYAFASSVWLNDTYLGSWAGSSSSSKNTSTYEFSTLFEGENYVLTIVVDNMGLDESWGAYSVKNPRGILDYKLSGRSGSAIAWKITGNLGGEDYPDKSRGPLNEGALYAERQGFHQPFPPSHNWAKASPLDGLSGPGIGFYSASLDLNVPAGWDVPFTFQMNGNRRTDVPYRAQLYVNGYQFGRYVNNIGPQTTFPVPEGVLNYRGNNWIAIILWAQAESGAKLDAFELVRTTPVLTGYGEVEAVPQPAWFPRSGAY